MAVALFPYWEVQNVTATWVAHHFRLHKDLWDAVQNVERTEPECSMGN